MPDSSVRPPLSFRLGGACLLGALALLSIYFQYRQALEQQQWTGATLTLGFGLFFTLFASVLGWFGGHLLARTFWEEEGPRRTAYRAALLILAVLVGFIGFRIYRGYRESALAYSIRQELVTPERAEELFREYDQGPASNAYLRALAQNPGCPPALLEKLATYETGTQAMVAANPSTPLPTLRALAASPEEAVAYYATYNPNLPREILQRMAEDERPTIKQRARDLLERMPPPKN